MGNDFDVEKFVREVNFAVEKEAMVAEVRAQNRAKRAEEARFLADYRVKSEHFEKLVRSDRADNSPEAAQRLELGKKIMSLFNEKKDIEKKEERRRDTTRKLRKISYIILFTFNALISFFLSAIFSTNLLILFVSFVAGSIIIIKFGEKIIKKIFPRLFSDNSSFVRAEVKRLDEEMKILEQELFCLFPKPEFDQYIPSDAFTYALKIK